MFDHGFALTVRAVDRQLAAMPCLSYELLLIHGATRRPLPGQRRWPACQILDPATIRLLRARNRDGFDVYLRPFADSDNAGYILLDLDGIGLSVLSDLRANRHDPCVVIQTSPGHLQAWVRVSVRPLEPALATANGRQLAAAYRADPASADWRHLGRLAGFTNQKAERRRLGQRPPWVRLLQARACLAPSGEQMLEAAALRIASTAGPTVAPPRRQPNSTFLYPAASEAALTPTPAATVYQTWLHRLRIPQRFPHPDWSVADLWIAQALLVHGASRQQVEAILRAGSPDFPRGHADPQDYLQRTLARAILKMQAAPFPARPDRF